MQRFLDLVRQVFPGIYYSLFGLREILDELERAWDVMWRDIALSFPFKPFGVIDAILRFTTQFPGILGSSLFYGMKRWMLDRAAEAKIGHRVMRLDHCIEGFFDTQIEWFQTFSGTNDSGLLEAIANYLGRFLYRVVKRIKFIRAIVNTYTEAQAIEVVLRSLRGAGRLTLILVLIQVVRFLVGWVSCLMALIGFFFHLPLWAARTLGQSAPRKRYRLRDNRTGRAAGTIRRREPGGVPP